MGRIFTTFYPYFNHISTKHFLSPLYSQILKKPAKVRMSLAYVRAEAWRVG
jgi:hypothetical protein